MKPAAHWRWLEANRPTVPSTVYVYNLVQLAQCYSQPRAGNLVLETFPAAYYDARQQYLQQYAAAAAPGGVIDSWGVEEGRCA